MKRFIFIVLFLLASTSIYSQKYQWAQRIGGVSGDFANSIAVDVSGNVYVAGIFDTSSISFNNGISLTNSGSFDGYVAKYNSSGLCLWAQKIAGVDYEREPSIAVDSNGSVYIAGSFLSPTLTFNNGISLNNSGAWDGYIAKYNSTGICQWAQVIAGASADVVENITVDANAAIYICGTFYSSSLLFNNGVSLTNSSSRDSYIAKYNSNGMCQWAQKIIGTDYEDAFSIAVDSIGNVYVAGDFSSSSLIFNNGISITNTGSWDGYIAKYDSSGLCQWAQKIAGSSDDVVESITVDSFGAVYISGRFYSSSLTLNNGLSLANTGGQDSYIAKYNANGLCQWAQKIAGTSSDYASCIAVDATCNVFVSGFFESPSLTFNNGILITNSGLYDGYFAKYNPNGICQWARNIGGSGYDNVSSVAIGFDEKVYITGYFSSPTLLFNNGISLTNSNTSNYYSDGFIAKYSQSQQLAQPSLISPDNNLTNVSINPTFKWNKVSNATSYKLIISLDSTSTNIIHSTIVTDSTFPFSSSLINNTKYYWNVKAYSATDSSALSNVWGFTTVNGVSGPAPNCQWAQKIGGDSSDYASSTTVDALGNIYVTGYFSSLTLNFNNGISLNNSGLNDAYIAKYNASGTCQWAQKIGGIGEDKANSIAVDASGNVYVSGKFNSSTLNLNNGINLNNNGSIDAFIAKYNSSGLCQWAQKIGGIGGTISDYNTSISLDLVGNVYIAGEFSSPILTFNNGISLTNTYSSSDAYFSKYNSNGICQWAEKIEGIDKEIAKSITVDASGAIYVSGEFNSRTISLNNNTTLTNSDTNGHYDIFIAKFNSSGICQWARSVEGADDDFVNSISIDVSGNVYIAGFFRSRTLSFSSGIALANSPTIWYSDGYIAKYNSSGICQWAEKIAGMVEDYTFGISTDTSGDILIVGGFCSPTLTFSNGISLSYSGNYTLYDAYIAKYNTNGLCQWARTITGSHIEIATSVSIAADNIIYLAGYFMSPTLTFNNSILLSNSGSTDGFIAKYSQPLSIPNLLSPANLTTNTSVKPTFSWNKVANATSYKINIATDSLFTNIIKTQTSSDTNFTQTPNLVNYTKYYWRVKAFTSTDSSDWSNVWNFTTITAVVPSVMTVTASAIAQTTASSGGNITSDGGAAVSARGVVWSTSASPTIALTSKTNDGTGTGWFNSSIVGLSANTLYYYKAYATNSVGTAYGTEVNFTTLPTSTSIAVPTSWTPTYTTTGYVHNIAVPTTINPMIGTRAMQNGDAIGFFYTDGTAQKCAGYGVWNGSNIGISVWGDNDQTTTVKEGFSNNENFIVKIWDGSLGKEYPANITYSAGTAYFNSTFSVVGTLSAVLTQIQAMPLSQGWNWISSNLTPSNLNMDTIANNIKSRVTLLRNGGGQMYWPTYGINSIGNWNVSHGYQVYMTAIDTLKITGMKIETGASPYVMNAGWNLISYKKDTAMNIGSAIASINSNIVILRNNLGQTYWPAYGINTIGTMKPGVGYQVYTSALDTLIYPKVRKYGDIAMLENSASLSPIAGNTGVFATLAVRASFDNGMEIAAYNSKEELVGAGLVNDGMALVTVWGDNEMTAEIDGALNGETIELKAYNPNNKSYTNLSIGRISDVSGAKTNSSLEYQNGSALLVETSAITGIEDVNTLSFSATPNPASDVLNISYTLNYGGEYSIMLYNSIGELVKVIAKGSKEAGSYSEKIDLSSVITGAYRIVLKEGANAQTKGITIVK